MERDTSVPLKNPSGMIAFYGSGVDYTFYRDADRRLLGHVGGQYSDFGRVSGLDNGFAVTLGLTGGLHVGSGFWVTLAPQVAFGQDVIFFTPLALLVEF